MSVLIAAEIRAELGRLDLTQKDLAARCHQSQPWVSRRLSGEVEIGMDEAELMAAGLDTNLFVLMQRAMARLGLPSFGPGHPSGGKVAPAAGRTLQLVPPPRHVTLRPHSPRPLLQVLSSADASGT